MAGWSVPFAVAGGYAGYEAFTQEIPQKPDAALVRYINNRSKGSTVLFWLSVVSALGAYPCFFMASRHTKLAHHAALKKALLENAYTKNRYQGDD